MQPIETRTNASSNGNIFRAGQKIEFEEDKGLVNTRVLPLGYSIMDKL